jgi:hypothetical protein
MSSTHQVSPFPSPVAGQDDATVILTVRGNDNAIAGIYNAHDADASIHMNNSTLASRPAAGTAGRIWYTTDTNHLYYDSGAAWVLII